MVQGLSFPVCKESRQRLNAGWDVELLQAPWSWPLGKELFLLWVRAQWPGKQGSLDWSPWGDTQYLRDFGRTSPLPTTWKESNSTQQGGSSSGGPRPVESAARALWITGLWPRLCQKVWLPPRSLGVLSVLQIMVHQCNPPLALACTSSHAQSSRCVWDPSLASNRETHLSYWSMNPAERKGQGVMTVLSNQHLSRIPSIQSVSHWTHPSGGHQWDLSKTRKCQALMRTICDSPSAEVEVQALEHGLLVSFHHSLTHILLWIGQKCLWFSHHCCIPVCSCQCCYISLPVFLLSRDLAQVSPPPGSCPLTPRLVEIPVIYAAVALWEGLSSNVHLMLSLFPVGFDTKFPCSSFHWFSRYYNTKVTIIDAKFKQCKEHVNDP